jgi:hypothetical protein
MMEETLKDRRQEVPNHESNSLCKQPHHTNELCTLLIQLQLKLEHITNVASLTLFSNEIEFLRLNKEPSTIICNGDL